MLLRFLAGGLLARAVSNAGALGLLGGGYGNHEVLEREFALAGYADIGCGFITWSMGADVSLLDRALARKPRALMLSFSNPAPYAKKVTDAGCRSSVRYRPWSMCNALSTLALRSSWPKAQKPEDMGLIAKPP